MCIVEYITIFPLAMSIRATNVYEEKSMGVYRTEEEWDSNEEVKGRQAVGKYLGWQ